MRWYITCSVFFSCQTKAAPVLMTTEASTTRTLTQETLPSTTGRSSIINTQWYLEPIRETAPRPIKLSEAMITPKVGLLACNYVLQLRKGGDLEFQKRPKSNRGHFLNDGISSASGLSQGNLPAKDSAPAPPPLILGSFRIATVWARRR